MLLLGYDLGSSSVKASLLDAENGRCLASSFHPKTEMEIKAIRLGWAEQEPSVWWASLVEATHEVLQQARVKSGNIAAIGISYQMHGLVLVDKKSQVLRPSIIWCDSRAVEIGNKAFRDIGADTCLTNLLNSPGNFTASKLKWVKDNEPDLYSKIWKVMLPGDYAALRMTGEACTTASGLSEGIFWDFHSNQVSEAILDYYGFDRSCLPDPLPTFSVQGKLLRSAAAELGLAVGTPVSYRAGDQPNNAFSLNVLNPGEIAATAGTSGVIYGVSSEARCDRLSRVNIFAHVNHQAGQPRLGVLLCINGTGILNSWIKRNLFDQTDYSGINDLAAGVARGSGGLIVLPFGNGAERMLGNLDTSCIISNLNFNLHSRSHLARAAQEGIVFSFKLGLGIMEGIGIRPSVIRAGHANMFLSPLFRQSLADLTGASIELYNTDGSQGAARGAGIGAGIYKSFAEAFGGLERILTVRPDAAGARDLIPFYHNWREFLEKQIQGCGVGS
ncbi:MAG TPA: FGGY family carbohydrate kinase [Acidobacteriota bacterium]|nr:FGGY family carbohydrate kinase [Acidobacteriota bacterium]